ncbi:MAG TPA: TonB-dependent receptor [Thermoanaerobaculia bacterium]|nr:TonB-dependent receptor [Thermoanaerobaculia bacterium]
MVKRTLFVLALLLVAASAFAQTTATINGTATTDGNPLPGVTVTIASPAMQGTRTSVTGAAGGFTFNGVPPGKYTVKFELSGMQTVTKTVSVGVSQIGTADAAMKVASVSEAITVTAAAPSVLETPTVSTNITGKTMETLPIQNRTPVNTAALAPGVNTNTSAAGQLSISGSPGYDNTVMVNGVVITEEVRSQQLPLYIEDAIQETTVLTGAISAEYGRFTGGVVNSITKSGGNEFTGSLRDQVSSPRWTSRTPLQIAANTLVRHFYNKFETGTLGGFVVKDKLWFFGAGRKTKTDTPNSLRIIPGSGGFANAFDTTAVDKRYEAKLTGQPFANHNISFSYLKDNQVTANSAFTPTSYDLAQLSGRTDPINFKTIHYNGILTNNFLLEGSWSKLFYGIGWGNGSPFTDFVGGTIVRNRADSNARYNSATFCGVCDKETRNNDSWSLKSNYFISTKGWGNQNIVGGVEDFREHRHANNYQSGSNFRVFVNSVQYSNGVFYPTVTPSTVGGSATNSILQWTPIFSLQQGESNLETKSAFVNDRWDFNDRWSFNVGLRYDKNHTINADQNLNSGDGKLAPRLSATYNVTQNGAHRVTASYSQYVSRVADGVSTANAAGGVPATIYYAYQGPAINPANTPANQLVDTATALKMIHDWLVSFCGGELSASNPCLKDVRNSGPQGGTNSVPGYSAIIGNLSSPYAKEITLGYGAQWFPSLYTRLDLVSRDWHNFYSQQTDQTTPQNHDLLGIPHDVAVIGNTNLIQRKYRGAQFQSAWRKGAYNAGLNYTYSTLKGNDEQESATSGTVGNVPGAIFYPELRNYSNLLPVGYLSQDERHRARGWFGYDVPIPSVAGTLNASVLQTFDSGLPYSAIANIDITTGPAGSGAPILETPATKHYSAAPTGAQYYFSSRGQYRLASQTTTNLALNWERPIGKVALLAHAYMNNVFNRSAVSSVNTTVNTSFNSATFQPFNPFTDTPTECPQGASTATCKLGPNGDSKSLFNFQKGASFGKAASNTSFQQPRTYYFNFGVRF